MPANVPIMDEFNALEARVAALESGSVTPPDPTHPSPDGTTATEPGVVLVSAALNTFALYANAPRGGMGILYNGAPDTTTYNVGKLYCKGGKVYQQETTHGDWYISNDRGGWSKTSDPTLP